MNRLQSELHRLYLPQPAVGTGTEAEPPRLIDAEGRVRAMVLELARPANWEVLSKVWRGVQSELELPAPAIAVSGIDGIQLWFSLSEPVLVAQAHEFLELLRSRFIPDIAPKRMGLMPTVDASVPNQALHARLVPAEQQPSGNWSAFVAPDLAPVFAETPWIDIPPGNEGQAELLRGLGSIKPPEFEAAFERLRQAMAQPAAPASSPSTAPVSVPETMSADAGLKRAQPPASAASLEAKRFLLRVMNDDTVDLALRIEAAKALLPCSDEQRPPQDN